MQNPSYEQAMRAHRAGQLNEAERLYREALHQDSNHADAHHMLGILYGQTGRHREAEQSIASALQITPGHPMYLTNLAEVHRRQGRLEEAIAGYRQSLAAAPNQPGTYYLLANALKQMGQMQKAVQLYHKTLSLQPNHAGAAYNLGNTYLALEQLDAARQAYQKAIQLKPNFAEAYYNLGHVFRKTNQSDQALEAYQQAVNVKPDYADALVEMANLLLEKGDLSTAGPTYKRAVQLAPNNPAAHFGLGNAHMRVGNGEKAIQSFRNTLELDPDHIGAHTNLGCVLLWSLSPKAIDPFQEVVRLQPDNLDAYLNLGQAQEVAGRLEAAKATFKKALERSPNPFFLRLHEVGLFPSIPPSNEAIDDYRQRVSDTLDQLSGWSAPVDLSKIHLLNAGPRYELAYQGRFDLPLKAKYGALLSRYWQGTPIRNTEKPHIGLIVTQGHESIFLRSMEGIINRLPVGEFRLSVACCRENAAQWIRSRLTHPDLETLICEPTFEDTLRVTKAARFDVAYFWEVGSDSINYALPYFRIAPVQCAGWGSAFTTGVPAIDYHLSSEWLEAPEADEYYSETLIRFKSLPTYYFRPEIPAQLAPKSDFGLPDDAPIYFCAQNLRKVHPDFDDLIGALLQRDPEGYVVFIEGRNSHQREALERRWEQSIPDVMDRIRFVPRMDSVRYLNLIAISDVSIDTLYYGGANTTYDAFAAGTPVVALPGRFQRGKYTEATYRMIEMADCLVDSNEAYVEKCVQLAHDRAYREHVKSRILEQCPVLFEDDQVVTDHLEFFRRAVSEARS